MEVARSADSDSAVPLNRPFKTSEKRSAYPSPMNTFPKRSGLQASIYFACKNALFALGSAIFTSRMKAMALISSRIQSGWRLAVEFG
jgi:hypothetical protein